MFEDKLVTIYKIIFISSSHSLDLPYDSKCNRLHGHNYKIEIWLTGNLDENGMVMDFYKVKEEVMKLDHYNLDEILEIPSTAENIAIYITQKLHTLAGDRLKNIKIRVWETGTAYAEYEEEY